MIQPAPNAPAHRAAQYWAPLQNIVLDFADIRPQRNEDRHIVDAGKKDPARWLAALDK